ncbi:MAG: PKD domain-containing protein [Ferruginibacter sp.]
MKKLSTLLLLIAFFLGKTSFAQCNAEFNITYQSSNAIQFNPVMPGDPTTTLHDWLFGDGGTTTVVSPLHTYLTSGTYTARHIIVKFGAGTINCRDTFYRVIQIQSPTTCNLFANFTSTIAVGSVSTVHFTNTTTPLNTTDSVRWTFGDGTESHDLNPTHTYPLAGSYNVCLRMQQRTPNGTLTNCVSEICHTIVVQNSTPCNLVANFTISPVLATPNAFHFTNTSTPLNVTDSLHWTFGDGSQSNDLNPTHTYMQPGTYSVCLRVQQRNNNGTLSSCIRESCHTVTVPPNTNCNLVANFTFTQVSSTPTGPVVIHFQNTSVPLNITDSVHWTFGDGTESTDFNPTHTYVQSPGTTTTYNVCLRVQQRNPNGTLTNCIREVCHPVVILPNTTCNLVANFTVLPVTATPNAFHFTNTSTPLSTTDSVHWTFGDGTSSNNFDPTHTYALPGTYNVCLRVQQRNLNGTLSNCIREVCHTVTVPPTTTCNLVASFTISPVTATANAFHFTNTSTPTNATDSVHWTFGDGTFSSDLNPTHTYFQSGSYNVCLRVQQRNSNGTLSNCVREVCHTVVVQVPTTCNLVANFSSTQVPGALNTFHFTNTSTPLNATDSVHWTFGDGTSSTDLNPTHTYTAAGTYTVCLRVQQRNPNGGLSTCVREICHIVIVQGPATCNLVANFHSYLITIAANPLPYQYHFENTSAGLSTTDSIRWTFGDGATSNQVSPNHAYAQPGTYNACLRIIKRTSAGVLTNCISEVCHPVVVQNVNTCNLVANFIFTQVSTTPTGPAVFYFQNTSTPVNATDSVRWTFGDGTSSNQANPVHTYAHPGTYNVCLRVQQRNPNGTLTNCVREVCHTIIVQGPTICNLAANFYSYRVLVTGTALPYLYHFENTSTGLNPTDSIRWIFGDGTTSNQVSPNHAYTQPGNYTVCLRIIKRTSAGTLTNCISETCHPQAVLAQTNTCNLQLYPNPASTAVSVNVILGLPQMIDVFIYNTSNILVKEKHQPGVIGNNIVTVGIADLVPGIYVMRVIHGNDICYATFVKL